MQKNTFESKEQLQNRLKEIEDLIKVLSEEKQKILIQLEQGDFVNKKNKTCVINDNIVSNRKEDEKEVEMNIEDDSLKKMDFFDLKYNQMTSLDSLKQYFDEEWEIDISQYSQYSLLEQDGNEFKKKARLKTFHFLVEEYIDFFDEQIEKAALTKEQFDLPPEQLKLVAEPFFEALITRSKVIDLYENCALKSGKLSFTSSKGVSEIQFHSGRSNYLLYILSYFLNYQDRFDWDYEKIKGVFDLCEGGFASSDEPYNDCNVDTFDYKMLSLLKNNKIKLTEDQKSHLLSIVDAVNDLVKKGWWEQRFRNSNQNSE